jgi:hypothetical protein
MKPAIALPSAAVASHPSTEVRGWPNFGRKGKGLMLKKPQVFLIKPVKCENCVDECFFELRS